MIYCRLSRTSLDGIGRGNQAGLLAGRAGRQAASRAINSNPFVLILPARERGGRSLLGCPGARPRAHTRGGALGRRLMRPHCGVKRRGTRAAARVACYVELTD
uniref:Uncharacterized protein n=1 Tax=Plectus sambesii TaxID=2011161 RepID=A0A914X4V7_9BILA